MCLLYLHFLLYVILIPIILLFFGIIILGGVVMRAWHNSFGKDNDFNNGSKKRAKNQYSATYMGNKYKRNEKVFDDDEGEYVDFEEIK